MVSKLSEIWSELFILDPYFWDLAEWLERLKCRSRNYPGFDPSIHRQSGIWGAADVAVLNKVQK